MVFNGGSRRWTILLVCVWAIVLAGCAELQTRPSVKTEELLSAAGFQMKLANTPEKRANLWKQVQHKLVPQECNGKMVYVYADAAHDRVFVGDPKAYQKFQALAVQNQIAREEAKAAAYNYGAGMNWGLWGPYPWGPYPWGPVPGYYY